VDQLDERVFLLRVEPGGKDHVHLHRLAAGAAKRHLLDRPESSLATSARR
jgi:hypothetical protein